MRGARLAIAGGMLAMSWAGPAGANWVKAVDLPGLLAASELIVTGRANGITWTDGGSGDVESFTIAVDHALKGASGPTIAVQLDLSDPGNGTVAEGRYGLFFLRQPAAGQPYVAADPAHPMLAASTGSTAPASASTPDPVRAVADTLLRALADPELVPGKAMVADDGVTRDPFDRYAYEELAEAVRAIPADIAEGPLLALATSGPAGARLWAANCLLWMSGETDPDNIQPRVLDAVAPLLLDPDPSGAFTVSMLGHVMRVNLRSPNDAPDLITLLGSHDSMIRRTAASALGDIGTTDAIAALATIALDDEDRDVRYYAVLGLAVGTGAGDAIAKRLYEQNEPAITAFWRGWVAANIK